MRIDVLSIEPGKFGADSGKSIALFERLANGSLIPLEGYSIEKMTLHGNIIGTLVNVTSQLHIEIVLSKTLPDNDKLNSLASLAARENGP